jgi:methylmalonyl-CoA mutase, N-terminal domain
MQEFIAGFREWKAARSQGDVTRGLDALARSVGTPDANVFEHVVDATRSGATHQEICDRLRSTMGFGVVQAMV